MIFSISQQFFAPTSRDISIKKRILVYLGQIFAMAFAQQACRESLRDIEARLRAQARRLHLRGFRCQTVSRNPLPNANAARPWQIRAGCAQHLIGRACPVYPNEPLGVDLYATACAFDAATIDLRVSVHGKPKRPCLAPLASVKAAASQVARAGGSLWSAENRGGERRISLHSRRRLGRFSLDALGVQEVGPSFAFGLSGWPLRSARSRNQARALEGRTALG